MGNWQQSFQLATLSSRRNALEELAQLLEKEVVERPAVQSLF